MHEYVQKLTRTTFPRSDLLLNGGELSHATAPSRSGIRPSSRAPDAIVATPQMRAAVPIEKARFFITKAPNLLRLSGGSFRSGHSERDRGSINRLMVGIHEFDEELVRPGREAVDNDRIAA